MILLSPPSCFQRVLSRHFLRTFLRSLSRLDVVVRSLLLSGLLMLAAPAVAVIETWDFPDPADEARYQAFIDELRCPKCQNQNLSGSDAPIAKDLRRELALQIQDGRSDQEILQYMLERYGDFILYRPRFTQQTLALWFGPLALLLVGGGVWWAQLARRRRGALKGLNADAGSNSDSGVRSDSAIGIDDGPEPQQALNAEEQARLAQLLGEAPAAADTRDSSQEGPAS